jgi:hypothetical protein
LHKAGHGLTLESPDRIVGRVIFTKANFDNLLNADAD